MSETKVVDGLQINQDLRHQKREWRAQRIAWVAMALLLLAALAGLLGHGPASRASAGSADALRVEYQRFERNQAPTVLRFGIPPALATGGVVRLRLGRAFVENVDIERIYPDPESVTAAGDAFVYEFRTAAGEPVTVMLFYRPREFGPLPVHAAVERARAVQFSQWVYP